MHSIAGILAGLAVILVLAKLGGHLAIRLGQPAVLGELLAGVLLGNLGLASVDQLAYLSASPGIELLAELGVIVLLFEVGLESTVGGMLKVGFSSLLVACLGVIAPFALGFGVGRLFLPNASIYVSIFLGATLTATSVGITARVLKDLGKSNTVEGKIILGAAVIDDVLGLVILAVVMGVMQGVDAGRPMSTLAVLGVTAKALAFLLGSLALGVWLSPRLFRLASRLEAQGVLIAVALAVCFAFSYVATLVGLAPIVGAFAAGLILEETHYERFTARGEAELDEAIRPISSFLVPIFFVLMGMRVDLRTFADPAVLGIAGALCLAAVLGKQVCAGGVIGIPGVDRLSIGIGMIPRGEVGLIFANIGLSLKVQGEAVISRPLYSAVVIMVVVTTLITPPALKWSLNRRGATS